MNYAAYLLVAAHDGVDAAVCGQEREVAAVLVQGTGVGAAGGIPDRGLLSLAGTARAVFRLAEEGQNGVEELVRLRPCSGPPGAPEPLTSTAARVSLAMFRPRDERTRAPSPSVSAATPSSRCSVPT